MAKKRKLLSGGQKAKLQSAIRQSRRDTLYRMLGKKNDGTVPCFVCGRHVTERLATLEHILPISLGGSDDMSNLAISHYYCNQKRGNTFIEGEIGVLA